MSLVYPDPIQGPNSPLAKSFAYQPTPHYPQLLFNQVNLRDYFAAAALRGLMGRAWGEVPTKELFNVWAKSSYAIADAMLKAREVKP